jgi:hypothetical protein
MRGTSVAPRYMIHAIRRQLGKKVDGENSIAYTYIFRPRFLPSSSRTFLLEGLPTIGVAERIQLCTALTARYTARLSCLRPELRVELLIADGQAVFLGEAPLIAMFGGPAFDTEAQDDQHGGQ